MANTYTLISSTTVGAGGASSISFSSIPSTYTDLVLQLSVRSSYSSGQDFTYFSFNGSTANFSSKLLDGTGSSALSYNVTDNQLAILNTSNTTSNTFSSYFIYLPNYTTSTNKLYYADTAYENNATTAYTDLKSGLWSSTATVSSIGLTLLSGNFVQYSTAYLYGIKNS
jgi:hypothetical protein